MPQSITKCSKPNTMFHAFSSHLLGFFGLRGRLLSQRVLLRFRLQQNGSMNAQTTKILTL